MSSPAPPSSNSAVRWFERGWFGLAVAVLATAQSALHHGLSNFGGDIFGAMPIAKEVAFPGTYPASDLIVSTGLHSPYHLYKAASWLYRAGVDVEAAWFALLLAFVAATFFALFELGVAVTGNRLAAAVTTLLLAMMPVMRGVLHLTSLPVPMLVSLASAFPLLIGSLALFFRGRPAWALGMAGLAFCLHPSALILLVTYGAHTVLVARDVPWQQRARWLAVGAAAALPNGLYTLTHLPGNFVVNQGVDPGYFWQQYQHFGFHAFVEDYWRLHYGWFFLHVGGAVYFARYLPVQVAKRLRFVLAALGLIGLLYAANLYLLHNRTVILLLLFRVSLFAKPLAMATVLWGATAWASAAQRHQPLHWLALAGLAVSVLSSSGDPIATDALLCATYALVVMLDAKTMLAPAAIAQWIFVAATAVQGGLLVAAALDAAVAVQVACGLLLAFGVRPPDLADAEVAQRWRAPVWLAVAVVAVLAVKTARTVRNYAISTPSVAADWHKRVHFAEPQPLFAKLAPWLREHTPKAALIAVPPIDEPGTWWTQLRIAADRGIYLTLFDIYQLAYDVRVYREGIERFVQVGGEIGGRLQHRDHYHALAVAQLQGLRRQGVQFAVFFKAKLSPTLARLPTAFDDGTLVAMDLQQVAP